MSFLGHWIAFSTLVRREIKRFMRIWVQTLLPSLITMGLYFLIFGTLMGTRIGRVQQIPYLHYIAPGLIMMAVINNAYANVSFSIFSMRFQKSIEELLIAPIPNHLLLLAFMCGGIARGLLVGVLVSLLALCFGMIALHSIFVLLAIVPLTTILFSLAGFTNGLFAKTFDDVTVIPSFVLTPLTYLGGVFYSIQLLPPILKTLSLCNPILYIVNAFRYALLGVTDVAVGPALSVITLCCISLFTYNLYLLNHGKGLKI